MAVDIRKIKKLIELLEASDLTEIEITEDKESVRLSRASTYNAPAMPQHQAIAPVPAVSAPAAPATASPEPQAAPESTQAAGHAVESPMVGVFYTAASPDAKPFAEIGQSVAVGDTLCMVEAMKMFNQIEADKAGTITACLVENGEAVEYGQPLFIIE